MDKFLLVIHCQCNCVMSVCMRLTDYRPNDDLMYHVAAYFVCFIYSMSQCEFKGYLLTYLLTYLLFTSYLLTYLLTYLLLTYFLLTSYLLLTYLLLTSYLLTYFILVYSVTVHCKR